MIKIIGLVRVTVRVAWYKIGRVIAAIWLARVINKDSQGSHRLSWLL
jgi:hypothetical protein